MAAVVMMLMVAAPASAGHGISSVGTLDPVEVVADGPEYDGGLMPEVVVVAEGPVMMLDEVESVAEGPRMVLDEVVVVGEKRELVPRHVVRIVLNEVEITLEHIN